MADLGRVQALDRQQVLLPVRHGAWSQKPAESVNAHDPAVDSQVGVTALRWSERPQRTAGLLAGGHAVAAGGHRQDARYRPGSQQFGGRAAIGAVVGAARAGPVHPIAEAVSCGWRDSMITLPPPVCMARTSRTQATPGLSSAGMAAMRAFMSREIGSSGSNATMSPTLGPRSPTWWIRPMVPTMPAERDRGDAEKDACLMPLDLLSFAMALPDHRLVTADWPWPP